MRLMLAALMLTLGANAALAADPAPAAESASAVPQSASVSASGATPEAEPPKLVCHQESDIGSMRMHKVCTKVQTDAERQQMQDTLRNDLPNSSLTHSAPGSGH